MEAFANLLASQMLPILIITGAALLALLVIGLVYLACAYVNAREQLEAAVGELETLRQVYGSPVSIHAPIPVPSIPPPYIIADQQLSAEELSKMFDGRGLAGPVISFSSDDPGPIMGGVCWSGDGTAIDEPAPFPLDYMTSADLGLLKQQYPGVKEWGDLTACDYGNRWRFVPGPMLQEAGWPACQLCGKRVGPHTLEQCRA